MSFSESLHQVAASLAAGSFVDEGMGGQTSRQGWRSPLPSTVIRSCPPESARTEESRISHRRYSCTNTAFFVRRCSASTSLLPSVEGIRTGLPLNILQWTSRLPTSPMWQVVAASIRHTCPVAINGSGTELFAFMGDSDRKPAAMFNRCRLKAETWPIQLANSVADPNRYPITAFTAPGRSLPESFLPCDESAIHRDISSQERRRTTSFGRFVNTRA